MIRLIGGQEAESLRWNRWTICFIITAWEDSSSLAAADSSLVAELVCTTAEI